MQDWHDRQANAAEFRGEGFWLDGAPTPSGYRITERSRIIGRGPADFAAARSALFSWQLQRGSRFRPVIRVPRMTVGAVSVFRIPFGPLHPLVVCRVVEVLDVPHRARFAHVALEGHPQRGWESFAVELAGDGSVLARIHVVAAPSAWWMRAAGPTGRVALDLILRRNLRALAAAF